MIRYLRTIDLKGRKYMSLQSFVKWAGGKRQIMDKLLEFMPKKYKHYYEPFVGGGALLLELAPIHATINDSNKELIYVYKCLRSKRLFKRCTTSAKYMRPTTLKNIIIKLEIWIERKPNLLT